MMGMDVDMMEKSRCLRSPLNYSEGCPYAAAQLFKLQLKYASPVWADLEMERVRGDLKGHLIYLCFMSAERKSRGGKRP